MKEVLTAASNKAEELIVSAAALIKSKLGVDEEATEKTAKPATQEEDDE